MLNLTCFLGFSSTWAEALLCHALLLDSWVLVCNFKSLIWRQSHFPGGLDIEGLGEGDEDCHCHSGEDFGITLICSCPSIRNVTSMIQTRPSESFLLAIWWPPLLLVLQRGTESVKWTNHGSIFFFLGPSQTWCTLQASPSHTFV